MRLLLPLLLSLVAGTTASYVPNLNYLSPSRQHPSLGISLPKLARRDSAYAASPWNASQLSFTHGVASGDPLSDSVILWTRAAPTSENDQSNVTVSGTAELYAHGNEEFVRKSSSTVCVEWVVARDEALRGKVDGGRVWTSSDVDFTVKVEAKRLKPFTTYFYRFSICDSDNHSPVGRTKTIPEKGKKVKRDIKLAVYSCSNFPFGFFNAYGNAVRKDSVDYVVHLGDYIYEYKNGDYGWGDALGRVPQPDRETFTLYDYRKRIAQYRTDADLLASHQKFPWIPVWDDHEVGDNTYKDGMAKLVNNEDSFVKHGGVSVDQRKANAVRAYFEWMPIRQVDMDDNLRIWRNFQFGDLFDLIMLDTRNYDRSITDLYTNTEYIKEIANDQGRSVMGARQESWFYRTMRESSKRAKWRVIGNQIIFSRIVVDPSGLFNYDQWDGYLANRNRTLANMYDNKIDNNIMLAGDSHASWVSDLVWFGEKNYDPATGAGSIGVEFAGSAVSSPSPVGQNISMAVANTLAGQLTAMNPELQWQDLYYRGYFELTIGYESVKAAYFGVPQIRTRNGYEVSLANFTVMAGENRLHRYGDVATPSGKAESGSLQRGAVTQTNLTHDTETGRYFVFGEGL
ncbi:PhoD-like phosphatase-domain-containing protein [Podospora aff. communis PSN243]|uniref:PhoD-like phosphatase-domain-containing protein n=1 Tax=Podospora aff. communis PSN243 TaxID=3040156 RepID=A0AAV9G000_9PEZI|nr:PhoD-like phosphatase-domain-containing protein [Podospora aff. communis PSN243]